MLIEQFARPTRSLFVGGAIGLASAKSRTIDVGLLGRLFALAPLPETVEIDHIPHLHPSQARTGETVTFENSECRARPRRAPAGSIIIAMKSLLNRPIMHLKL
jgi:hypothetical protein